MTAFYKQELRQYFLTPVGYIFISAFLTISGTLFSLQNLFGGSRDYATTLSGLVFIFLIVVPILTMRLFTDEKQQQTETLLFTSPIMLKDPVLGKFFAALTVFGSTLLITMTHPLIMSRYGLLDWSVIIATYIGFFLLGSAFIAVGVLVSDIAESQSSAAIMTFSLLLSSWIIDFIRTFIPTSGFSGLVITLFTILLFSGGLYRNMRRKIIAVTCAIILMVIAIGISIIRPELYEGLLYTLLTVISVTHRFAPFALGIIDLGTIIYYLAITIFCLYLTTIRLERRRWSA